MKVLIVDDEPENSSLPGQLLKGTGCEVLFAHNGLEAEAKLQTENVDIVIFQDLVASWQAGRLPAPGAYSEERSLLRLYHEGLVNKLEQRISELDRELADLRKVEAQLHELGKKHQAVLEAAGEAIVGLDRKDRITFINRAVTVMTGFTPEDLIGRDFHQTLHHTKPDGTPYPAVECPHYNAVRAGIASDLQEERLWRKDGSHFIATCRATPIIDDQEVSGAVLVIQDIAGLKESEEVRNELEGRLRQAQRMEALGALAGGITHEFNNIIGIVLGHAELGWLKAGRDNPLRNELDQIIQAGYRARNLVKQISGLRRQNGTNPYPLQVYLVVKEALKLLRASLPAAIAMQTDMSSKASARVDPTQIYQILTNLCIIATRNMREAGGTLEVCLADIALENPDHPSGLWPGPYIHLKVSGVGHGTSPRVKGQVGDPEVTTREPGEDDDSGLSVVQTIVRNLRGDLTHSCHPGETSTFSVFLPRLEDQAEVESHRTERLAAGKERILFVDDDEALVELGHKTLQHLGYDVFALANSREALEFFKQSPRAVDLLVTNQTMPHMTGAQLARTMLCLRPGLPVILCTGYSDVIPQIEALQIGIREYLIKPFGIGELAACVRRVLDESRLQEAGLE